MELLDRYLQAVKFWLPKKQKQDIIAELSEDLRSQIEDREAELGRNLNEPEIATLLKRRGRPVLVANRFLPQERLTLIEFFVCARTPGARPWDCQGSNTRHKDER